MNPAILALEDGTVFEGSSFGAPVERTGEVVFNTAITGYQEVFTDPSYSGQIVVLTYPQIGNYGSNEGDNEAAKPHIEGLVVREFSPLSSNWRADETAQEFLTQSGVPVISEIAEKYKAKGVVLYGINEREQPDEIKDFLKKKRWNLKVALDTRSETGEAYGVDGIPQTVLIDKAGVVQAIHAGFSPDTEQELT